MGFLSKTKPPTAAQVRAWGADQPDQRIWGDLLIGVYQSTLNGNLCRLWWNSTREEAIEDWTGEGHYVRHWHAPTPAAAKLTVRVQGLRLVLKLNKTYEAQRQNPRRNPAVAPKFVWNDSPYSSSLVLAIPRRASSYDTAAEDGLVYDQTVTVAIGKPMHRGKPYHWVADCKGRTIHRGAAPSLKEAKADVARYFAMGRQVQRQNPRRNPSEGAITRAFFAKTDASVRAVILRNIAKHYGISAAEALSEVTDDGAESLLDYVTGAERAAVAVLMQRHGLRRK